MDFGLARQHQVDSSLSQSGMVVGTPQFMSPEQALGDTHGVGARSDVYSLGATLFALLTGRPPFQAENIIELLQKVVNVDVEPPRQKHPEIPRDLETIVLKALDKDPERRYMTAQALAADLQRFLEGEPIQARPASLTYRIRKRLAKRKAFVGVVGAAVAAVVLLTAAFAIRIAGDRAESRAREEAMKELGGLWLQVVVAREGLRSEGTPPRETAARIAQALDRVSTFVSKHPNRPEGNFIRARGWVTLGDLDRAEADLKRTLELNPSFAPAYALLAGLKLERHVRARYGDPETRADRLARAEPLVQEADAWIRKLAGSTVSLDAWGLPPTPEDEIAAVMARALSAGVEASDRSATARILEAENEKRPSEEYCNWMGTWETDPARRIDWFNRALKRMPYHAKSRLDRGAARAAQGDLAGAVEDYTLALEISPQLAPAYFNRGNAFRELGRTSDAIADFSKVIELDPTDADAFFARGNARRDSGDPAGAIQDFDRAIGLRAGFAAAFTSRGVARKLAGDLAAAIADHAKAIEIHPGYAKAYANRGNVLLEKDDVDGAIADYSKAIEFDPGFAGGWHNRGEARRLKGDLKGAIDDHSRAIERDSKFAEAYAGRGYALLLQEDVSAALKDLEIAIRLKPEYARSYAVRGVARQAGGDDAGALADYDKAIELDPSAPDPYFNRALLRQGGGDLRGALDDLTHAIDRKPTHPEARACRGLVREQLSRYEPKLDGTAKLLRAAEEDLQAALKVTSAGWKYRPLTESSLQRVRSRLNELREQ